MSKWIKQVMSILFVAALLIPSGWLTSNVKADITQLEDTVTIEALKTIQAVKDYANFIPLCTEWLTEIDSNDI
ncbi:hypothetical protein P4H66_10300 [Paenibacillus dokdonensis]|uniref:Uncharacterized protein n=1 Tax=Paenibacillus dokdonensis TaxID=2567944 RepID=A0ABU6GLD3_9BACL|nr:hypothetical protein [Paenibacillus dokdonensis]MEC0240238.1 hypothetical protein [Paenibacillus dokdonensis]